MTAPASTGFNLSDGTRVTVTGPADIVRAFDKARGRGIPMKPDPEIDAGQARAMAVTADELRQFVERIEQLAAEKADLANLMREVFAEAKGRGYDTKALRKLIALRKRKPDDVAAEEAILATYMAALGMV